MEQEQGLATTRICADTVTNASSYPTDHFKVTVTFPQVLFNIINLSSSSPTLDYIMTPEGLLNSPRTPQDGFIYIGSQQSTEAGPIPNDIILPSRDQGIDRYHCTLDSRRWFRSRRDSKAFLAFLMVRHTRLGQFSCFHNLSTKLFMDIYSFVKEAQVVWLADLKSEGGTYVKVRYGQPVHLQPGQTFRIGCDHVIEVDKVSNSLSLSPEDSESFRNDTKPTIKFTVSRIPYSKDSLRLSRSHIFIGQPGHAFLIGRSEGCDIKLKDGEISRIHCRIVFQAYHWLMFDGQETKASSNGTWMSVCTPSSKPREECIPFPVTNGTEIKISESVLQVTWNERDWVKV